MRRMKLLGIIISALMALASPVLAQSPVTTQPSAQAANNFSSTIAVTNTFQSVMAASAKRFGCSIQNNGSSTMWVYFGPIANATKGSSFVLGAGQGLTCGSEGVVSKDQVSITGTSADAFTAVQDAGPTVGPSSTVTSSGGAATIANGADVAEGAIADAAATAGGTGTVSAKLRRISTQLPAAVGQTTMSASLPVVIASDQSAIPVSTSDPCTSAAKSSVAISVATATTTSLVAVSGSTTVYVCGFAVTIAPSAVTAATALFEYGTGAACTSPTVLTGTFGNGDLTSTVGVAPVIYGGGSQTVFKSASSAGICILTAGNAVSVQGVLTYVQQ